MKSFATVILIILLAIQAFYPLILQSYYYANKNFIASVLCENKSKPQLHCNGKCYLKKLLKKAEEQESKDETAKQNIEAFVYIITPALTNTNISYCTSTLDYPDLRPDFYAFHYHSSCFRPPGV